MWYKLARFILRNRYYIISVVALSTAVMAYFVPRIEMDYNFGKIIPQKEPAYIEYEKFRKNFGDDGSMMVVAVENTPLFELEFYNKWYELGKKIDSIPDIDEVVSITNIYVLEKNKEEKKFELKILCDIPAPNQEFLDSIAEKVYGLKIYEDVLYKEDQNVTLLAIRINEKKMASKRRIAIVDEIEQLIFEFEESTGKNLHVSGLPFIRSFKVKATSAELKRMMFFSVSILIVVLLVLFRSFNAVMFPILLSLIGITWAVGLMVLFGYKITILTAIVPNLIVIIGIPNCVYLLNKYYTEIRKHGNKIRALSKVIEIVGFTIFYANLTTSIGFGVFYFTGSSVLEEFGLISFIMVVLLYCISLTLIPIVLSFMPLPKTRAMMHLESKNMLFILNFFQHISTNHKKLVYAVTLIIIIASAYGTTKLYSQGYILDDVPHETIAYRDLKYFEQRFKGILPVEILIDTKKKGGALQMSTLKKIDEVQDSLFANPLFAKPTSMVNALKYATQAYYNGNPNQYRLPKDNFLTPELGFILQYLNNSEKGNAQLSRSVVDSAKQVARITVQIPDIGSQRLDELRATLDGIIKPIFPAEDYKITYTGTSIVALEGYRYLNNGLMFSVGLALLIIGVVMALIFRSGKMLLMAMIPNLIPLFLTAGLMGYFGIPLKPSTVLVFSIAFGMSVDYTIHFLAKYKQELQRHQWDVAKTVKDTINEMGMSMLYTSIILFFGFGSLVISDFDGTKYLGMLISITLIASLFSNMVLLPALLATFDKRINFRLRLRRKNKGF
jgi:predicted RND superfamily exporter protein